MGFIRAGCVGETEQTFTKRALNLCKFVVALNRTLPIEHPAGKYDVSAGKYDVSIR